VDTFVLKVRCRGRPGSRLMLSDTSLSDDRRAAQPGQSPNGSPLHGTPGTAGAGPALSEAAQPGPEPRQRRPAGEGEQEPDSEVDRNQRGREVAAGQPD